MDENTNFYVTDEGEKVSTVNRYCKDVPPPAWHVPDDEVFYSQLDAEKPDVDFLKQHFMHEGRLSTEQALFILKKGAELLKAESTLLELPAPINVCGDIHGQYFDLMKLLDVGGVPGSQRYLFLGDYVDRGYYSIECFLYLLALKINFPDSVYLLRGNHECKHKYSDAVFSACLQAFNCLPLAAIVNKQFFCVHGGLSPELSSLDDIRKLNRFREPPSSGLMCDLLWSDPITNFGSETTSDLFVNNRSRGCSYSYTYNAVCAFLEKYKLLSMIRAHEAQDAGYRMYKKTKTGFPAVITMFSAPNYLDVYNNKGAILKYDGQIFNIRQFSHSPHPYWLPNFMDVFTWSVPFVGEKVTDILLSVLNFTTKADKLDHQLTTEQKEQLERDRASRKEIVKNKVQAVAKMSKVFAVLREERETIAELKKALGKEVLPPGTLALGIEEIKKTIQTFDDAKKFDAENELLPPKMSEELHGFTMTTAPSLTSVSSESLPLSDAE